MELSFSAPCERNKQPILEVLAGELESSRTVLEIGSGSGQHVVHFAAALSDIDWQPTDLPDALPSLNARVRAEAPANVRQPHALDVLEHDWTGQYDAVYSSNTLHIMSWTAVEALFAGIGRILTGSGCLCIYGPFTYADVETTATNLDFDRWLRDRDPLSGLRSFEAVDELAGRQSLTLDADYPMPANNRLLIWRRR